MTVTSRLLSLAKAAKYPIIFSEFQGGNIYDGLETLESRLQGIHIIDLSDRFDLIGEKASDLRSRQVSAYGILDLTQPSI